MGEMSILDFKKKRKEVTKKDLGARVCMLYSTQGPRALIGPPSSGLHLRGVHYSSLRETLESKISINLKAIRKNTSLVCRQHFGC